MIKKEEVLRQMFKVVAKKQETYPRGRERNHIENGDGHECFDWGHVAAMYPWALGPGRTAAWGPALVAAATESFAAI